MTRPKKSIPFNRPTLKGTEFDNMSAAYSRGDLSGNGAFSKDCEVWLQDNTGTPRALLTHSCTGALEMAAILQKLKPGDEVIMPSYTFVSTANAVVLRGATPVFCDIRADTLNIDETLIEALITPQTRAIWVVHYAGVACEMATILDIADRHDLGVVEDAAQAICASYRGQALGTFGDFGTLSFHETKNVTCGEGGALFINAAAHIDRAEIIHEKGTNRRAFARGEVDKYTWHDLGSSFLLGELAAAFLRAQLDAAGETSQTRLQKWQIYHEALKPLEISGDMVRPVIPQDCVHNAHMYYIILAPHHDRREFLAALKDRGVHAVFHYVPLHLSPASTDYTRAPKPLTVTEDLAARIVRLPLYPSLTDEEQAYVIDQVKDLLTGR